MGRSAWMGLVMVAAAVVGCGDDGDVCADLQNVTFASEAEMECGLGPSGPVMCNWTVAFRNGRYFWNYSDLMEEGDYACDGASITGTTGAGEVRSGSLDEATGVLTWEGARYLEQQP